MKVIEAKDGFAKEFIQPVKMTVAKKDLQVFDKEEALASVKKSEVFGCTELDDYYGECEIQCWPTLEELSAKSEETLRQLRLKKVEWWAEEGGSIPNIRFTLSDNTVSEQINPTYFDVD